jgi:hypothetical protein
MTCMHEHEEDMLIITCLLHCNDEFNVLEVPSVQTFN